MEKYKEFYIPTIPDKLTFKDPNQKKLFQSSVSFLISVAGFGKSFWNLSSRLSKEESLQPAIVRIF